MKNYENYLLSFCYLSFIDKTKYGKCTNLKTKDGFMIYEPFSFYEFERKMELNISFNLRWFNEK